MRPPRQPPLGRPEPPDQRPHRIDRPTVRGEKTEVHVRNARISGCSAPSDDATDRHAVPGGQVPGVRPEMRVVPEAAIVPIDVRDLPAQRIRPEPDRSAVGRDDRSPVPAQHVLTVMRVVAAGPSGCSPAVRPGRGAFDDERGVDPIRDPALGPSTPPCAFSRPIEDRGAVGPPTRIGCPTLPGALAMMPAAFGMSESSRQLVPLREGVTRPNALTWRR